MATRTSQIIAPSTIKSNDPLRVALASTIDAMYETVPLTYVHFIPVAPAPTLPVLSFTYQIKTVDGRLYTQTITFNSSSDPDPTMTFNVPVGWKLSEFAQQRFIRDLIVKLVNKFNVSRITYDFA